jgi:hypothetical protein
VRACTPRTGGRPLRRCLRPCFPHRYHEAGNEPEVPVAVSPVPTKPSLFLCILTDCPRDRLVVPPIETIASRLSVGREGAQARMRTHRQCSTSRPAGKARPALKGGDGWAPGPAASRLPRSQRREVFVERHFHNQAGQKSRVSLPSILRGRCDAGPTRGVKAAGAAARRPSRTCGIRSSRRHTARPGVNASGQLPDRVQQTGRWLGTVIPQLSMRA